MHSFRLRYIVLGLFIYIQSAFCRTCGTEFDDVASRTVTAGVVFEGTVKRAGARNPENERFNATFSVRKVLKGDLPRQPGSKKRFQNVLVGTFGPEDREDCIGEVRERSKYIVFLEGTPATDNRDGALYRVSGFPEKPSKKVTREVRKYSCNPQESCVRMPTGSIKPKRARREEGEGLKLECKAKGNPTPVVSWLKDGKPVVTSRRLRVKTGKRSSTLQFKKLQLADSGKYQCLVRSVAGSVSLASDLRVRPAPVLTTKSSMATTATATTTTITTTTTPPPPPYSVRCKRQGLCLNGGTCWRDTNLKDEFCRCPEEYSGRRCESLDSIRVIKTIESRQAQKWDRGMTAAGLTLTALVLISLCLAAWIMAKRRRAKYYKKKEERKRLRDSMSNGNYRPVGVTDCPSTHIELQPMISTSPAETSARQTQTEDSLLRSLLADMSASESQVQPQLPQDPLVHSPSRGSGGSSQVRPDSTHSHASLPRQNTAPASIHVPDSVSSSSRSRLRGVSSTPDAKLERQHKQHKANMSVVNAVVESDPEHVLSSPLQGSGPEPTPRDANERPNKLHRADTERSDYDNEPSDVEVNLESEVDLHAFEGSGDELEGFNQYILHHGTDSESDGTADTSSIEDSPEKALFAKMIAANPRKQSEDSNPEMNSWVQQQPSYAYNPYTDDRDVIPNRYLVNDRYLPGTGELQANHKPMQACLHQPIDPDPEATVV